MSVFDQKLIIGITGHTSGIGKALYESKKDSGYLIQGFSRTNGYNVDSSNDRWAIINALRHQETNIFINNAQGQSSGQTDLLLMVYDLFRGHSDRQIINIGSISTDTSPTPEEKMIGYKARKASLHHCVMQLQKTPHHCRIVNIRFGFVDTPLVQGLLNKEKHTYLTTFDTTKIIMDTIYSPFYLREVVVTARK